MIMVKRAILIVLIIAILLAVLALSSLNADRVIVNLYFFQFELALGLTLVLAIIAGLVAGMMLSFLLWIWPLQRANSQLRKKQARAAQNNVMMHD
ncbi:lipopolysaccharide assembly protein LapA domain-containing protein [Marinicella sp. W31]|uniref:lipopolysaccharide assembly protein LapA domain-containing protein n=1 Tax=Marinicella sp. W31 TaxID=3023713 RepID=UPI00375814DF